MFSAVVLYYLASEDRFIAVRFVDQDGEVETHPVDTHGPVGYGLREIERLFKLSFCRVAERIVIEVIDDDQQ